jgi:pimeloyl-ACP methyl ester carboxylesterase
MHEVRFSLPNLSLSGLTSGESNKPLVLCLHGWLDNAASFVPISHYLQDYHLVAIDFAGHGLSQHRSPDAHYHQFILLGHSMGGIVGSLYVSSFPEKVSRYITIESFGPLTKTAESSSVQLRESIESRINLQARTAKHPESFENAVRARALAGDLTSQAAEILVNRNLYEQDGELKWRTDRRLRTISSLRVTDDQAISFMQNITCPTLAIRGDSGYKMMREKMQERADWLPELSIIECKGGHHLHMDNPKEVAKHINRFLQDR